MAIRQPRFFTNAKGSKATPLHRLHHLFFSEKLAADKKKAQE
jgi:hypothetical protein